LAKTGPLKELSQMQLDAPQIRDLKRSGLEIFLQALAGALMLAIWGIAIYQFRLTGESDLGIFALPSVFMLIYFTFLGVWWLSPRYYNLWIHVTEENARLAYGQARRLICVFHVLIMVIFALTAWGS
jgi:hypothetical protein